MLGCPAIRKIELAIVWSRDHSVWRGFDILDSRSAKILNLSGMWLTNRAIPLCLHHSRVFHTYIQSLENVHPFFYWYTTPPIMTVLLTITYWASLSARDTVLRGHWYGIQTPWNESSLGSRCAPASVAGIRNDGVAGAGLRATPWTNRPLFCIHWR